MQWFNRRGSLLIERFIGKDLYLQRLATVLIELQPVRTRGSKKACTVLADGYHSGRIGWQRNTVITFVRKQLFGDSQVIGCLHNYKMEKSSELLAEGEKINDIAMALGYKHVTHFTSAFKKHFGFLPHKIKAS